ncbi:hypothetical protein EDB80DRAFT_726752, partial [Ilyonectria destructans]
WCLLLAKGSVKLPLVVARAVSFLALRAGAFLTRRHVMCGSVTRGQYRAAPSDVIHSVECSAQRRAVRAAL